MHPELLLFYDYEKNEGIDPRTISYGLEKKVWWKCPEGHSYEQPFHAKSSGAGCPYVCINKLQKIIVLPYYILKWLKNGIRPRMVN